MITSKPTNERRPGQSLFAMPVASKQVFLHRPTGGGRFCPFPSQREGLERPGAVKGARIVRGGANRGLPRARWTPESHGRDQAGELRAGGRNPKDFVTEVVMHEVRRSGDSHRRRCPEAGCFHRMPRSFSMSCVHRLLTVVMLLILGSPRPAPAQDVTATLGVTRTVKSTILGEDRKVLVRLPTS